MMNMKTTDKPKIQKFHLKGVKHILPEDAQEAINNKEAVMVDVRNDYEVKAAHIADSLFLPMWNLQELMMGLPRDKNVILLCNEGINSTHIAHFMAGQGFNNLTNLDGGITAWKERNLPYVAFKKPKQP